MKTSLVKVVKWTGALLALLLMVAFFNGQVRSYQGRYDELSMTTAGLSAIAPEPSIFEPRRTFRGALGTAAGQLADDQSGPMIVRSLSLSFEAQNLAGMRARIDELVGRFHGYVDSVSIESDDGSPTSLSANLRIPSEQFITALSEFKRLGTLTLEKESGQDVTTRYADLTARLSNARRTEQRLLSLLSDRTGKLADVVLVEKELGTIREQVEQMESQQRRTQNQVRFASVNLEFRRPASKPSQTVRAVLQMAMTDGYLGALESTLGLALAIRRYGPTLAAYFVIFLPFILVAWRRYHPKATI